MTKISIAMTTYNGRRYIEAQLASLMGQTRPADEVVICDDCSTDATADIVGRFISENGLAGWRLSVNDQNLGFVENFYRSVMQTSGDIVFLCDQDDVWHAEKIETMMRLFETNKQIQALNTSFREVDSSGNLIMSKTRLNRSNHNLIRGSIRPGRLKKFDFDDIIWRNISPGCTAAFRRPCIDLFGRYFTPHCPHDWALNIFGAVLDGLFFYNDALIDYRVHTDNTIGLVKLSLADRFSMQTDAQKRIARAQDEAKRGRVFADAAWRDRLCDKEERVLRRYERLTVLRYHIVTENRLSLWLRAIVHFPDYLKLMGPQGMIEDLKQVLKKR